jgi:hypothetical protein
MPPIKQYIDECCDELNARLKKVEAELAEARASELRALRALAKLEGEVDVK